MTLLRFIGGYPLRAQRFVFGLAAAIVLSFLAAAAPIRAQEAADDAELRALIQEFVAAEGNYNATRAIIDRMAVLGDARAAPVLRTLDAGLLYFRESDQLVFAATE